MENPFAFAADFVAPPVLGLLFCLRWGAVRGVLYAIVPLLIVVLGLFVLQVSPGVNPDGSTRLDSAMSYMLDDAELWIVTFAVGAALGWAVWRNRAAGA